MTMAYCDALIISHDCPPPCDISRKERSLLAKFSFAHYQHCMRRFMKRRKK